MKKHLIKILLLSFMVINFNMAFAGFDIMKPIKSKTSEVKQDIVFSFIREIAHIKAFAQLGKVTNGDHWFNLGFRGTINLSKEMDFKFGFSEYFTGLRGGKGLNHDCRRLDLGFFYKFAPNISVGFVSSQRFPIEGFTQTSLVNEFHDTKEWIEFRWTL